MTGRALLRTSAVALGLAACTFGTQASTFPPATTARGAQARVELHEGPRIDCEMLEVRDDGLLLLCDGNTPVTFVAWEAVDAGAVRGVPVSMGDRKPPDAGTREQLRLASRHPYSVPPEVMSALLASHGQTAPARLPR
jgi:hypothetical protein